MNRREAEARLQAFNHFQECILLGLWTDNLSRDLVILIHNIWETPEKMRADLETLAPITLRFRMCQRILINNAFSPTLIASAKDTNWSLSEFSLVTVKAFGEYLHFEILWENDRKIEIVCSSFEIEKTLLTPEILQKYSWPYLDSQCT